MGVCIMCGKKVANHGDRHAKGSCPTPPKKKKKKNKDWHAGNK